ncbi:MAG: N-acetyltransferase [Butyrivibrio sp.]|nr:N-acetyltransferase [Butyrivibrio sp.]
MSEVYEKCPIFENNRYMLRFVTREDASDLLDVYSDKLALPFFNSDNCDGDNFYYPTLDRMEKAIDFWISSYEKKWFVRWSIIDKKIGKAIGTIELFNRVADDDFNGVGVLRLDVGSCSEKSNVLEEIVSLIIEPAYDLFDCSVIITKAPIYAVERIEALKKCGFEKSDSFLLGKDDKYPYNGYWIVKK